MENKWKKFSSSYSPVPIDKPNTAGGNLVADWYRESGQNRTFINGIPLSEYAKEYNGFATTGDVEKFFNQVILKDMISLSSEKKTEVVDYLKTVFHQGGLMYPVSSAFATSMEEYNEELDLMDKYATVGTMNNMVNIKTTPTGFKVQEVSDVKFLWATPGTSSDAIANENFQIVPDDGKDFVVKLQGTIDINFTKDTQSPSITIESNNISYGNQEIQSRMDQRNFGQKIVDFFKNILGLNKVEILFSPEEKNEDLQEKITRESPKL